MIGQRFVPEKEIMPRNTNQPTDEASDEDFTISIYQNSDHVAGLVQQLFDAPLVTELIREDQNDSSNSSGVELEVEAGVEGKVKAPLVGEASLSGDVTGSGTRSKAVTTGSKSTQSFVYSQAYYLRTVRQALRSKGKLKAVTNLSEALKLRAGDFVEYQANFAPSELTTIMDVVTPDLVAQITNFISYKADVALFDGYDKFEAVQIAAFKAREKAAAKSDLAREVTQALKADFRQTTTREYYGTIGDIAAAVTAITICDNSHFVIEDADRILDGTFTVLGKITSAVETDVPVLQRNKLLRNISADGVDAMMAQIGETLSDQSPTNFGGTTIDNLLDLKVASRVGGASFRVMPIAIYV